MADFTRKVDQGLIDSLQTKDLFTECLRKDIESGRIFFAIRPKRLSFYRMGRSLFNFDKNGFSAYSKFAFVPTQKEAYVTEAKLGAMHIETDFSKAYPKILERASLYADPEALGVSNLYKFAPCSKNTEERYFLVDIEVVFNSAKDTEEQDNEEELDDGKKESKSDRIDILLYDNHDRKLLFVEAKTFDNSEIWSARDVQPKVIDQLNKYDKQISNKKDSILEQYTNAFAVYNQLLGVKLNAPEDVCGRCGLLVFGFKQPQLEKAQELRDRVISYKHKCRIIGGSSNLTAASLFKEFAAQ